MLAINICKWLVAIAMFTFSGWAYAVCTTPSGVDGELVWIAAQSKVKFCDGTNWIALNDTVTATACSNAGQISYVSSEIMYCNGSFWVKSAPATNHGACAVASSGSFYYDSTGKYYWFCNGSNWRRMGP